MTPPPGWQFCTGTTPTPTWLGTGDITLVTAGPFSSGSLTLSITCGGTVKHDQITITGLQVQPLTVTAPSGNITASTSVGIFAITTGIAGTSFGKLRVIPAFITNPIAPSTSLCTGHCITLTDPTPGGTWSSSNTAVATVTGAGVVCPLTAGSVTITYTVSGCPTSITFVVSASPAPITGSHNMCAWYDSLTVCDATTGGLYSSTGVTTFNIGGGCGKVKANMQGVDTIIYVTPNGCSSVVILTVNPLPAVFMSPPYSVCVGLTKILTDPPGPGTWSSSVTTIGSVASFFPDTGVVTGLLPGVFKLTYTLSGTGCKTDTPFTVNPNPGPIAGPTSVCELSTILMSDITPFGGWSSTDTSVATIDTFTGLLTARHWGTTVILYRLSTGCETLTTVTVNPLPADITGVGVVCVGSTTTLFDATPGGRWSTINPGIGTIDSLSGVVGGIAPGTVVMYYTTSAGCQKSFVVTVNPVPDPITGPRVVCVGSYIVDTEITTGGAWITSDPTIATVDSAGYIYGWSTGFVTICYTLPTGCMACVVITVNPTPGHITGPDTVCVGNTIHLSDPMPGGIWTSSFPLIATVDTLGNVTGVHAGIVTITYSLGACYTTYVVTVDPLPDSILGPSSVCQGDSVHLTDTISGGTWTSSDPTYATVNFYTGWVTGVATGSCYITYTVAGGCYVVFYMAINAKAPITGPLTVCVGETINLNNADPNPAATWTLSDPVHATITSSTVIPLASANILGNVSGTDTVFYTQHTTGCQSYVVVTVNPITPIFGATAVCVGSDTSVFDATPGGVWSNTNPLILSINGLTGKVHGVSAGVDTIKYTISATGCMAWMIFTVNPLPTPIYGPTQVCMGDTSRLYDTTAGGAWTAVNGNATIDATGLVTGVIAGMDTIYYQLNPSGCYMIYVITVNQISPINGPDSVCVGSSIHLYDTSLVGGVGGVWSNLYPVTGSVSPGGDYYGLNAGVDTVYYTMPSGCKAFISITVNPLPGPIIGPPTLCTGQSFVYTDVAGPGMWTSSNPGVAIIGSASGLETGISAGTTIDTFRLFTGGCYVTMVVTVNQTPPAIVGPSHLCRGDSAIYTIPTAGGVWSDPPPNSVLQLTVVGVTAHVTALMVGVDTILYTIPSSGCSTGKTITVNPIPIITVDSIPPIKCKYDPVVLIARGAGPGGTYVWAPTYALSNPTSFTTVANPTVTTTYTVTGTDVWGCDSFATVTVKVDDSLNHIKIVGLDSICEGTCDTLKASGRAGSYFNWHPASALSCTICDTVVACPTKTTLYWAVAIDDIGCKDSVSFRVTVNPLPIIGERPNPAVVCKHTPMQVNMYTTNTDDLTTKWAWSPNLFLSCDSCANPILTDTNNIVYNVTATTIYGCSDSFKVKVSVLDTNVNKISIDTNICAGTAATLVVSSHSLYSNLDVPTFFWYPDSNSLSNPDSTWTLAFPNVTRTYSVAIHENACFSDTLSVTVFVQPYPQIILTPISPDYIVAGTPTQLTATVLNTLVKTYLWKPPTSLTCDTCYTTVAIPTVTTTYTVTVTSIYGCVSEDSVKLILSCDNSQVFIPNTFTPNGDGKNDRFFISGKGLSIIRNFSVYNRWGQLLFEAHNIPPNDPGYGWDGTFKGLVLEPDVFIYIVEAQCELGGTPFKYKGDVSIVK